MIDGLDVAANASLSPWPSKQMGRRSRSGCDSVTPRNKTVVTGLLSGPTAQACPSRATRWPCSKGQGGRRRAQGGRRR